MANTTLNSENTLSTHSTSVIQTRIQKALGITSLIAIIYIHFLDLPGKMAEVPYLGYSYILLMLGCAVAAGLLLFNRERQGWLLGGAFALGAIVAYVLNRTVGLPLAMDDIGNWTEPLGVYSMIAEVVMVAVTAWALKPRN